MDSGFPNIDVRSRCGVRAQFFQRCATDLLICVQTGRKIDAVVVGEEILYDFEMGFSCGFVQAAVIDFGTRYTESLHGWFVTVPAGVE